MAKRYHIKVRNIVMGVPITFLDKYNPNQFEIETNSTMSGVSANFRTYINGSPKYARIFIRKKPKKTKRYRVKVRNIVMGVPITFLDKYNPKQFEIVSFRKGDNGEDLIFTKKKENEFNRTFESLYDIDSRSDQEQGRIDKWEAYIRENNNKKSSLTIEPIDCFHVLLTNGNCASHGKEVRRIENESPCINGKWLYTRITIRKKPKKTKRYRVKVHNIVMGVPITFLDKYNPKQFEIETNSTMSGVSANFWTYINGSPKYARIFIRKKPKKTKRYHVKVRNIVMGVPITFLDKYNPNQFEIVSFRKGDNGEDLIFTREREREFNRTFESLYDINSRSDQRIDKWEAYIRENNNKKGLAGTFIDEPIDCFHVLLTNGVNKLKVDTKNIFKRLLVRHKKQNKNNR